MTTAPRTPQPLTADQLAETQAQLSEYERLNPQQCPAGEHADWLVDSEYAHACPWCQIGAIKARLADALAQIRQVQALDTYSANRLDLAARILTDEEATS